MRTPLIAATAAALSALAVTVAGTAFGSGAHRSSADDPGATALRACLAGHGASVPGGDALVLKQWLAGDRTAEEKRAMIACGLDLPQKVVENAGPDEATLRACLTDHGATVPSGDGFALKRWIVGGRTSTEKDALKACGFAPPGVAPMTKGGGAPCGPSSDRVARAGRKPAR
jgi:hypothetical protein